MVSLKLVCTRKYFIDDKRGWKLFLKAADGPDHEAKGEIIIISKDNTFKNTNVGDNVKGVQIGS